jgi:hypothetical protein
MAKVLARSKSFRIKSEPFVRRERGRKGSHVRFIGIRALVLKDTSPEMPAAAFWSPPFASLRVRKFPAATQRRL